MITGCPKHNGKYIPDECMDCFDAICKANNIRALSFRDKEIIMETSKKYSKLFHAIGKL